MENLSNQLKTYIETRAGFNTAGLARLIDWNKISFHQWLKGHRPIPEERAEALQDLLERDYGFVFEEDE